MFCFIEDIENSDKSNGRRSLIYHLEASLLAVGMVVIGIPKSHAAPGIATQDGLPQVPHEYVPEIGAPAIVYETSPTSSDASSTENNSSAGNSSGTSASSGSSVDYSGNGGDSAVYASMLNTDWGATAADNALGQGITPDALAGLAQVESSMGANATSTGYAQGVFQMSSATFNDAINAAVAADPSLVGSIVSGDAGRLDPVTEAAAASEYLYDMATNVQASGQVSNPTFLDAYTYYMFGAGGGRQVENAFLDDPNTPMSSIVSATVISQNPSLANQTVGQWRASISNKVGSGIANSPVLTSS